MRTSVVSRALRALEGPARQNALGSFLIQGSQRLSRVAAIIAAAALLTPASFAALAVALALTDMVRGGLLAFDVGAVRLLARGDQASNVVRDNLYAKIVAGSAGLAFVGGFAVLVYGSLTFWLVVISGAGVLAASFGSTFLVVRQAALSLRPVSPRVAAASMVGTALAVILVWLTSRAVGVVVGLAIGDGLLLVLVRGRYDWRRPRWRAAVALVRARRSLLVMQLAYIGQFRIGILILASVGPAVAVGEYAIASRIAEGLVILAAALTASSLPLMGAAYARDRGAGLASIFDRSYSVGLWAIAPLVAALVVAAPIWISILFPQYPDAGQPFAIVGLAVIIFFASSQTTALLNAAHRDRAASLSAVAGLIISVFGSVSLVSLGAVGVAWARVAGELVRLLVEAAAGIHDLGIRSALLLRPWLAASPVIVGAALAASADWQPPFILIAVLIVVAGTGNLLVAARIRA